MRDRKGLVGVLSRAVTYPWHLAGQVGLLLMAVGLIPSLQTFLHSSIQVRGVIGGAYLLAALAAGSLIRMGRRFPTRDSISGEWLWNSRKAARLEAWQRIDVARAVSDEFTAGRMEPAAAVSRRPFFPVIEESGPDEEPARNLRGAAVPLASTVEKA
jgi:hypothetical protein